MPTEVFIYHDMADGMSYKARKEYYDILEMMINMAYYWKDSLHFMNDPQPKLQKGST
jgi:hypothetical protein